MRVAIIGMTQPVDPSIPSPSALLAYCARVSSTANQHNHETGGKLLRSLIKRKEWSSFEMVSITMEIETTRDIARQILRHRSFSFQEFSQRYSVAEEATKLREARIQHPTDKQASVETDDAELHNAWRMSQEEVWETAWQHYDWAIRNGIAKEVARAVLPEGLTPSRLYVAGTLRSWIHYIEARTYAGTQKEHREIAEAVARELTGAFPDLADVFGAEVQQPA